MFDSTPVHEAGHAVVAELLDVQVIEITFMNINDGCTEVDDSPDDGKMARIALGGITAVDLFLGPLDLEMEDQDGDDCDLPLARLHARKVVGENGDLDAYLSEARQDVTALLRSQEQAVRTIADQVVRRRGLSGDEVRRIIDESHPANGRNGG